MSVKYAVGIKPDPAAFVDLYRASTLGQYRPLEDADAVGQMIGHANLLVTAWEADLLVGIARSFTDFTYIAYLADLVVRDTHQKNGIGTELIRRTQQQLGDRATILLWAAPQAEAYYPKLGFRHIPSAWLLGAREDVGSGMPS